MSRNVLHCYVERNVCQQALADDLQAQIQDWLGLLAFCARKRELIDAVLADEPAVRDLPLYAWLQRSPLPVNIYWAP